MHTYVVHDAPTHSNNDIREVAMNGSYRVTTGFHSKLRVKLLMVRLDAAFSDPTMLSCERMSNMKL